MTRDEEFANLASQYAALNRHCEELAAVLRAAQDDARKAADQREAMQKQFADYLGSNIRTRLAVVGATTVVRAEYIPSDAAKPTIRVTVEEAVKA